MRQYYIHVGSEQIGPLSFDALQLRAITRETMIWYEGLIEWQKAGTLEELESLFKSVPPPINNPAPPPINQQGINTHYSTYIEDQPRGNKRKNIFIIIFVGIIAIVGISAFASYQNNEELRERQFEMQIEEQDRIIREQRIQVINKELNGAYKTLDEAKAQLHDASAFKLLRTADERHQEITEAEKVVKSWEGHISKLESELESLKKSNNY